MVRNLFLLVLIIFECLSAQAKEVSLFCYTFKGNPQGTNFVIDTEKRLVRENSKIFKKPPEYEVISWSSEKIIFRDKQEPIHKLMGYMNYSINRVNLDYFVWTWNGNNRLEQQLTGKCDLPHTKPQF